MKKGRPKKKEPDCNILTKDYLSQLYYDEKLPQWEIAKITGVAKWTIQQLFKKYNIEVRKIKNRKTSIENEKKLNDANWLFENHVNQKKSLIKISKELGVSDITVARKIKQFNINQNQSFGNYIWNIFKDDTHAKNTLSQLNKTLSITEISQKYNVSISCISLWFKKYNITPKIHYSSKEQNEIYNFLSHYVDCEMNNRTILSKKELDIYIPSKRIAIEMNGLYFHSTQYILDSNYHKNKTIECQQNNVKLLQIYDKEWNEKKDIIKSMLLYKIGLIDRKIYARKCNVKLVSNKESFQFYNDNHIQGGTNSKINIALFIDEEMISCMSFTPSRFNKKYEWELSRFCSKTNIQVIGGASKLLNSFIKNYNPKNIISYADKRISVGGVYEQLGFSMINEISPNYFYFVDGEIIRKEKYRRKNLPLILNHFDLNLSEKENTENNGIYRVYDCGKLTYLLEL
jgi:transposase